MTGIYTAIFDGVTVAAQQDFFEVIAPATTGVLIHEVRIGQSSSTTSTELSIRIKRGTSTTTTGSGGTTPTPGPLRANDGAAASTVKVNNTTKMVVGSGAITQLLADSFNILNGWMYLPTPAIQIGIAPSQRLTVELATTPGSSLTVSGTITFEEQM